MLVSQEVDAAPFPCGVILTGAPCPVSLAACPHPQGLVAPAQAALALSYLLTLKKHHQSACPVILVMSCSPHVHQDCRVENGKEGGSLGDSLVVKWMLLDHWACGWLSLASAPGKLGIPAGLFQPQQDLWHGACTPSQPVQLKVRALGFKTAFISSFPWVPGCGLEQLWGRLAPFC